MSSHTARARDRRTPQLPHAARLHPWAWERDVNADGHQTRVRHAIPRHRHISKVHITRLLWKSWRAARVRPQKEAGSPPGAAGWPGVARAPRHRRARGSAGVSCPPFRPFSRGSCHQQLGCWGSGQQGSQLPLTLPYAPGVGLLSPGGVHRALSTRPRSPRDTGLAPSPPRVPRRGFFCPQLVEGTSCLWPQDLRGSHRPRGGRRSLEVVGLRQTSFPADNLQIFTEGLLCSRSVPRSAGQTEMPCNRQGACVPTRKARLTLGNQGSC